MTAPRRSREVRVSAPAKLNLGLEILGPRPDGYHDLATIFQAIDLVDLVVLLPSAELRLRAPVPGVPDEDNLGLAALGLLRERTRTTDGACLTIAKAIPTAAGLGGASTDAAAALLAGSALWGISPHTIDLPALAMSLGSDVPFFLRGGTAFATGRGERLEPLPTPTAWAVVVSPRIEIPRKTATLYAALRPADFTSGSLVREQAERLRAGVPLDPALLANAFARPLYALRPELAAVPDLMRANGAGAVALSGAGPSHYTLFADPAEAAASGRKMAEAMGNGATVAVAAILPPPITVAFTD